MYVLQNVETKQKTLSKCRIVRKKTGRKVRHKVKSVFLTSELSFRSEK